MLKGTSFSSRVTGWNAIKSRAQQLKIEMTDEQYKACTAKIKKLADIRNIKVDDADAIIRAFHRSVKTGQDIPLLPDMTEEEKQALAQKEVEENDIPEKRALDEVVDEQIAKKAKNGVTA